MFLFKPLFATCLCAIFLNAQSPAFAQGSNSFFQPTGEERFRNGVIHHGNFNLRNQEFPGFLLDYQDPQNPDPNYLAVVRLAPPSSEEWTWPTARAMCKSLGSGWDLPTYPRRFQVVASQRYALSAGIVSSPAGREEVYAFWVRNPTDELDRADDLTGRNKNNAYVVSLNNSPASRQFLPAQYLSVSRLGDLGIAFLDGVFFLGSDLDAKHLRYQAEQTPAARASLVSVYLTYFERLRSLSPDVVAEIQTMCSQGNGNACMTFNQKRIVDAYLQKYGRTRVRGQGCSTLSTCLEAAARAQDAPRLASIILSDDMVNWWESFPEDRQFRHLAGLYLPALQPIWDSIQNWRQTGKLALYCAQEFPKPAAR